ncbi:MAG: DoxX family protein [Marivivens sp.]
MFSTLEFWVWVATALLVVGYGMAGFMKGFGPVAKVQSSMAWAKTSSPALIRFIGIVEVAGAIGLVLPVLTGILPWLTPLAAAGLALLQLLAIPVHVRVGDIKQSWPINLAFLGLSLFVLWARSGLFHS